MTRRIAVAILAVVWVTLILGALVAYGVVRGVLLADLDRGLRARAMSLPEVVGRGDGGPLPLHEGDRYVVSNEVGATVARSGMAEARAGEAEVADADFLNLPGGERLRRITLRVTPQATAANPQPQPLTVVFSGSAATMDGVLRRLALVLGGLGVISGAAAAWVAVRVARSALRPLASTAGVIGSIDERSLGRRIDVQSLPVELHAMAQTLNEMLARLELSQSARQQFMADASHELRTPVTALVTTLEVALRRPRDEAAMREVLADCLGDARLLRELVERLLEQVKSEQPVAEEPAGEVALGPLIDECVRIVRPLAARRGVTIEQDTVPGVAVRAPRGRLRNVLVNLMSNAVEYNRPGGRIDIIVGAADAGVTVAIRDTGVGIAAGHLPRIFDPFYRVDAARTGAEAGHLGMGLFLVQSNLRGMGGWCEVASEAGAGTTFTVHLPAMRSPVKV